MDPTLACLSAPAKPHGAQANLAGWPRRPAMALYPSWGFISTTAPCKEEEDQAMPWAASGDYRWLFQDAGKR